MLSQDLLDRAIANDIDAIYQVACCYGSGTDVEQDDETAFQWFMKGAGLGDLRAKQKVGWAYYSGSGVEQDYRQALQWLSEPAEQGDVLAQDLLGWIYQSGGDGVEKNEKAAFEWFRKAADNGYANSCRMVASAYEEGSGTEKSLEQAFYYYLKGAEDGDDGCQCEAGRMYLNGEGVAKNDSEAERLLRASAAQGYAQAMNYLCHMFLGASGHAIDLEMFNQYYEQLKKTREEVADWEKEFIDKWLRDLSSKKNNVQLQTLADKANHGDTNAMVSLGMFYMELFGNENLDASQRFEALDQATERFRAAVKAENSAACMMLVSAISIHATIMDEDYGTEELNKMWLEAYETFQKYREGKPNEQLTDYELSQYQQILMGLCRTALRQNDSSAAEKWAKAAVEAYAEDAELYLGVAYEKQGRHEEAIELLETIESGHMPQFALRDLFDVMYAQAMALAGTSQYERAVKLAEMGQSIEWGHEEATNLFADFEETVRRLAAERSADTPPKAEPKPRPNPKPKPEPGRGDKPKPKKRLYALIGFVGLAAVVLLILAIGNKNRYQPGSQDGEAVSIQETEPADSQSEPEQAASEEAQSSEVEPSAEAAMYYRLPTFIESLNVQAEYRAEYNFEYTPDGAPDSVEIEEDGTVFRAEFEYYRYFIIESALYKDGVLLCKGEYHLDYGTLQSITYTFYDDFGQEKTGSVDFFYSQEGDTFIIDMIPNMEEEFYYLPERFLLVPGIGTGAVPYGAKELRFEYKVNPDGAIRQLHVINMEPQWESDTVGWLFQYHSNGIPSMIGKEYQSSDIQQVYYDESGFPLYSKANDLKQLDVNGQSFTESEFVKIFGFVDNTGKSDYYSYEVYETNAQHSEMTHYGFFPNGELMWRETTEWEYYPVNVLKAPFPFIYHCELDY